MIPKLFNKYTIFFNFRLLDNDNPAVRQYYSSHSVEDCLKLLPLKLTSLQSCRISGPLDCFIHHSDQIRFSN